MKTIIKILILTLITINVSYSQVVQQWVQRFTSDSVRGDGVNDMFVDAQGNVYVTGWQRQTGANRDIQAVTVKYNSLGVQQWIQNYVDSANQGALCRAIHVDGAGNVYVTGDAGIYGPPYNMLVIKYSPTGTQLWSYRFQYVAFSTNRGYDIITDATGNVYVTGEYGIANNDVFLVKFGPSGNLINQTAYNFGSEGGRRIALDGAGKIIVGGYLSINQNDSNKFVVLKYEQNLDFVWASRFGSRASGNPYLESPDMAIDINSNIIFTGQNNLDYATFKLNSSGVVQWSRFYDVNISDIPRGVVTDNVGNIYVTGQIGGAGFPFTFDFCTIKYNPNGDEQWVRTLKPTYVPNGTDGFYANDIAIDNSANVYVTGSSFGGPDIITAKYNTAGSLQWVKTYSGGTSNSTDYGVAVGVDQNGNTYATGNSNNNNNTTGNDIVIIKYVAVPLFVSEFKKNAVNKTIADLQNVFDTISVDFSSSVDYYVYDVNLKIDTVIHTKDSDLEFYLIHNSITDTVIYQVGGTGQNFIGTILNDSATATIASGTAPFTGSYKPTKVLSQFNNMNLNGTWILKIYDRATGNTGTLKAWSLNFLIGTNPIGIQNTSNEIPNGYALLQNYPNPFNPITKIQFALPMSSFATLVVFDVLGREVQTLVNEQLKPGTYEVDFDGSKLSSGVYFYKLVTDGFIETKKMILIK